jgi:hypothetical protein
LFENPVLLCNIVSKHIVVKSGPSTQHDGIAHEKHFTLHWYVVGVENPVRLKVSDDDPFGDTVIAAGHPEVPKTLYCNL